MRCVDYARFRKTQGYTRCNKCYPCRVTRRDEWISRLLLEWDTTKIGGFITLTYDSKSIPDIDKFPDRGNLSKPDLQKFIKRLRKNYHSKYGYAPNFRYFAVGEYGEKTLRPHYHILFFGTDPFKLQPIVSKSWTYGFTDIDPLNRLDKKQSDQSVLNRVTYVVKHNLKLNKHVSKILPKQQPEFSTMSRRPALGHTRLKHFAAPFLKYDLFPIAGLTLYEKYLIDTDERFEHINSSEWYGGYKVDQYNRPSFDIHRHNDLDIPKTLKSKYYRLDKSALRRLAKFVNHDVISALEYINDNEPIPLEFADHMSLNINESIERFNDYNNSSEHDQALKISSKSLRKLEKIKTLTRKI